MSLFRAKEGRSVNLVRAMKMGVYGDEKSQRGRIVSLCLKQHTFNQEEKKDRAG